jgi:hypothetical protein
MRPVWRTNGRGPAYRRQREAEHPTQEPELVPSAEPFPKGSSRLSPVKMAGKGGPPNGVAGKREASSAALAQGRPGSLNGLLPGFAGPLPFTARALLPFALASPAAGGHRFGKRILLSLESSIVARSAHAPPFARGFLGAIHKALTDEPPASGRDCATDPSGRGLRLRALEFRGCAL